jgi:hypothetical protein
VEVFFQQKVSNSAQKFVFLRIFSNIPDNSELLPQKTFLPKFNNWVTRKPLSKTEFLRKPPGFVIYAPNGASVRHA